MEPSRYLVEQRETRGLRIEQGTIERRAFEAASFDTITLWDVIDRLTDPKKSLLEIFSPAQARGTITLAAAA